MEKPTPPVPQEEPPPPPPKANPTNRLKQSEVRKQPESKVKEKPKPKSRKVKKPIGNPKYLGYFSIDGKPTALIRWKGEVIETTTGKQFSFGRIKKISNFHLIIEKKEGDLLIPLGSNP